MPAALADEHEYSAEPYHPALFFLTAGDKILSDRHSGGLDYHFFREYGLLDPKKLAVIHIVKKELGLTDEAYRHALRTITGVRSAKELDDPGFHRLMRAFARSRYYRQHPQGITFRQKYYIQHLVTELGWDETHFMNFLKKYYKTGALDSLSKQEASKVITSLRQIGRHRDGG